MWDFKKHNTHEAIFNENGRIFTYDMLEQKQIQFFKWINHRTLIFLVAGNNMESLTAYVSCIQNHVVPLLLPEKISDKNLLTLVDTYKPEYLWMPSRKRVKSYYVTMTQQGYTLWNDMVKSHYEIHEELALLLITSGTTGSKKLVRISYQNLYENTRSICKYLKITRKERTITTLPMSYTFGLSIINTYLMQGASIVLTGKGVMRPQFWECMEKYRVTSFSGVPYTYELLKKLRFEKKVLPELKVMTQAGGKLSLENQIFFEKYVKKKQIQFYIMYGQTEATARMSYLPPDLFFVKKESIGIPIPKGRFFLEDESGRVVSESYQQGELVYTGANVSLGYAENWQDLKEGDKHRGRLYTGDMAYRDEDGCYYIVGRKSRFAKVYGLRINLDELEQNLYYRTREEVACVSEDEKIYIVSSKEITDKINLDGINAEYIIKDLDLCRNENGKICYQSLLKNIKRGRSDE